MNLEQLMNNPYAWSVLAICTVAAFVFAIYTWIKGKKKKEISCYSNSVVVVAGGKSIVPELQLVYRSREIKDMTITRYVIWNSGNEVLNWGDVVSVKSLKVIAADEAEILDARIVSQSDETNMFELEAIGEKTVNICFDYANVNDGIVLQILHTGKTEQIYVDCKIKGGKALRNLNKVKVKRVSNKKGKLISTIMLGIEAVMSSFMAIIALLEIWDVIPENKTSFLNPPNNEVINYIVSAILVVMVIILYYVFYSYVKRIYHIDIPAKLRNALEYKDNEC